LYRPILHGRGGVRLVAEQHRRGEHSEARIDADEEIDRSDIALDIAELHAFNLARYRPELAGGIKLHFDTPARSLFQLFFIELDELVLRLVDGRSAELHDEVRGCRWMQRRAPAERRSYRKRRRSGPAAFCWH